MLCAIADCARCRCSFDSCERCGYCAIGTVIAGTLTSIAGMLTVFAGMWTCVGGMCTLPGTAGPADADGAGVGAVCATVLRMSTFVVFSTCVACAGSVCVAGAVASRPDVV